MIPRNFGPLFQAPPIVPRKGSFSADAMRETLGIPDPKAPIPPARQSAIDSAVDHAGDDWRRAASDFLRQFAGTRASFTGEDLARAAHGVVPDPPDARSWGGIVQAASRAGVIKRAGYAPRALTGNPQIVWARVGGEG